MLLVLIPCEISAALTGSKITLDEILKRHKSLHISSCSSANSSQYHISYRAINGCFCQKSLLISPKKLKNVEPSINTVHLYINLKMQNEETDKSCDAWSPAASFPEHVQSSSFCTLLWPFRGSEYWHFFFPRKKSTGNTLLFQHHDPELLDCGI